MMLFLVAAIREEVEIQLNKWRDVLVSMLKVSMLNVLLNVYAEYVGQYAGEKYAEDKSGPSRIHADKRTR